MTSARFIIYYIQTLLTNSSCTQQLIVKRHWQSGSVNIIVFSAYIFPNFALFYLLQFCIHPTPGLLPLLLFLALKSPIDMSSTLSGKQQVQFSVFFFLWINPIRGASALNSNTGPCHKLFCTSFPTEAKEAPVRKAATTRSNDLLGLYILSSCLILFPFRWVYDLTCYCSI